MLGPLSGLQAALLRLAVASFKIVHAGRYAQVVDNFGMPLSKVMPFNLIFAWVIFNLVEGI